MPNVVMKKLAPHSYLLSLLLIVLLTIVAMQLRQASNEEDWKTQFAHLPVLTWTDDNVTIHHIRNYRYSLDATNGDDVISSEQYLDQTFAVSSLVNTWYAISHFGAMGMAHVFLSFEFTGGQYLVVSVEARQVKTDDGYDPVKGFFRAFTKTVVLGTEQDVIGLRTHIRDETTYLYQLNLSKEKQQELLRNLLNTAGELQQQASFYNTIFDNCMTGLLKESDYNKRWQWLDYRILLPGYSDELAYQMNLLANPQQLPLAELRQQARIDASGFSVDDPLFSQKIRSQKIRQEQNRE